MGLDWVDVKGWIEDIKGRDLRPECELVNNRSTHKRLGLQNIFEFDFGDPGQKDRGM